MKKPNFSAFLGCFSPFVKDGDLALPSDVLQFILSIQWQVDFGRCCAGMLGVWMLIRNGTLSEIKCYKATVILFVFRRQKNKLLILCLLKRFVLLLLTLLNSFHLLELLVAQSSSRSLICFLALKFLRMSIMCLWNLSLIITTNLGFSQTYMHPVLLLERGLFCNGLRTSTCLILLTGW